MVDTNQNPITKDELNKNMIANSKYKAIASELENYEINLKYAYICDDRLIMGVDCKCGTFYIDGFTSDNKHPKVRYSPPVIGVTGWYNSPLEMTNKLIAPMTKMRQVYEYLATLDVSDLYTVYEKNAIELPIGAFDFNTHNYSSKVCEKIIEYLKSYYKLDSVRGSGYCSKNRIVVITEKLDYSKTHFAPAYYDMHIFTPSKNGQFVVKSIPTIVKGTTYNDFGIDKISNDDGTTIEIALRSCLSDYSKCDDFYYAYGTISSTGLIKINPFIFSQRYAERNNPFPDKNNKDKRGEFYYIVTVDDDTEHLTSEEAVAISKASS